MRIEPPSKDAAAEIRTLKTDALLVAESKHFEGKWELAIAQSSGAFNCEDDTESAIEAACVAHGIEVGAEQKGPSAGR
jgi:hypothetical protein